MRKEWKKEVMQICESEVQLKRRGEERCWRKREEAHREMKSLGRRMVPGGRERRRKEGGEDSVCAWLCCVGGSCDCM